MKSNYFTTIQTGNLVLPLLSDDIKQHLMYPKKTLININTFSKNENHIKPIKQ